VDISAAVALGFDDRIAFQQLIGLGHGLAIELEIVGELPDRRQRIARLQNPGSDRGLDLLDELLELGVGLSMSMVISIGLSL